MLTVGNASASDDADAYGFSFPMRKILLVQLYLYLSRRHRPPKEGQYHCTASGTFFQWVSLLFQIKFIFGALTKI